MPVSPRGADRRGIQSETDGSLEPGLDRQPDLRIEAPDDHRAKPNPSRHPWWSRVLYAAYGGFAAIAAWYAYAQDQTSVALAGAGIALVLLWKATQRVR